MDSFRISAPEFYTANPMNYRVAVRSGESLIFAL